MADISIQFHSLPEELTAILAPVLAPTALYMAAIRRRPFQVVLRSNKEVAECIMDDTVDRLCFSVDPIELASKNTYEFVEKSPGLLLLDVGRLTPAGLNQSCLSTLRPTESASAVWQAAARMLKKQTRAGAIGINPDTGATGYLRTYRSSEGARKLDLQGVKILPIAGVALIHFEEEPRKCKLH